MTTIDIVNEFLDDLRGGRMVDSPIVRVEQGQLQGKLVNSSSGKGYYSFQGIPYAAPPLGSLRFKAPRAPEPWEGVRDATAEGNICAQIEPLFTKTYMGDENCLFLNVYTPNLDGEFLPVMVWIHGGAFLFGSGSTTFYGPDYLIEKDVVVVTINYRCGALGFLSLNTPEVPGNAGLKDVVQALKWVKDNIHNFGGNSGNITVFGESAGAAITSIIAASPLSKNLISKVIIQSGSPISKWAVQKNPIQNAKDLAKELGCDSNDRDEILEFLTTTPVRDLVEATNKLSSLDLLIEYGKMTFTPVIESEFAGVEAVITEPYFEMLKSGKLAKIPIMIGTTTLETIGGQSSDLKRYIPDALQIQLDEVDVIEKKLKELYFQGEASKETSRQSSELLSDVLINKDIYRFIKTLVEVSDQPIYSYKFDYVGDLNLTNKLPNALGIKHPGHMDELGYLFKNDLLADVEPTPQDLTMRERIVRLWTNFAKCGNPTPDDNYYLAVNWLPVTKENMYYLKLSNELTLVTDLNKERMEFWYDLYNKHYKPAKSNVPNGNEEVDSKPIIVQETVIQSVVNDQPVENVVVVQSSATNLADFEKKAEEIQQAMDDALAQNNGTETVVIVEERVTEVVKENKENSMSKLIENSEGGEVRSVREIMTVYKETNSENGVEHHKLNGSVDKKVRTSNEIKMVDGQNVNPKDVIRANDPPEDDLPKNIGVNKYVNFFESLGKK